MSVDTRTEAVEALLGGLPTDGAGWYVEDERPGREIEARVYDRRCMGVAKPTCDAPERRRALSAFIVAAPSLISALLTERDEAIERGRQLETAARELEAERDEAIRQREAAEQERDAAVKMLGRLGEVLVNAGFTGGDRDQTMLHLQELVARAATAEAKVADLQDALEIVKRHRDEEIAATDKAEARVQALEDGELKVCRVCRARPSLYYEGIINAKS